jgi:hypothetical protein
MFLSPIDLSYLFMYFLLLLHVYASQHLFLSSLDFLVDLLLLRLDLFFLNLILPDLLMMNLLLEVQDHVFLLFDL